jgi:hypothetical protein
VEKVINQGSRLNGQKTVLGNGSRRRPADNKRGILFTSLKLRNATMLPRVNKSKCGGSPIDLIVMVWYGQ